MPKRNLTDIWKRPRLTKAVSIHNSFAIYGIPVYRNLTKLAHMVLEIGVPDKELYAPGDTAEILVQSPFGAAEGLLTVSRGAILYTEQFTVGEEGYILE